MCDIANAWWANGFEPCDGSIKGGGLKKHNVQLIGATEEIIDKAEDREKFKNAMEKIGCKVPESRVANTIESAVEVAKEIGFPCVIRPAFTLGGTGGGIAYNVEEVPRNW